MNLSPIQPDTLASNPTLRPARFSGRDFERDLNAAAQTGEDPDHQLREAAEGLVSAALIAPMLEQMRNDPFKSDLLGGGFAHDAFQQQLHTRLADRVVAAANFPLVDSIIDRVRPEPASAHTPAPAPAPGAAPGTAPGTLRQPPVDLNV